MQKSLRQSALSRGHLFWARGPDNAGYYNSRPHETGFFCDGGDYDSYYGRFFLNWYSGVLMDHVDQVLSLASLAFDGAEIVVKVCNADLYSYCLASEALFLTSQEIMSPMVEHPLTFRSILYICCLKCLLVHDPSKLHKKDSSLL